MVLQPGEVKVLENRLLVGTGSGPIEIEELQPEGKQKMPTSAYLNGNPKIDGEKFQ